jgi:prepilin-type processing-associated H-X9-DG protein/prepilin-type N-terminal cleavage/methylation domain-containing protein
MSPTLLKHPVKRGMDSGRNGAFTLIELVVVLAIIAVLAVVLSLSTCHAFGEARAVQCAGNLRSLGVAFQLYATDNGNHLPQAIYPAQNESYDHLLLPYLGNDGRHFICPSVTNPNYPAVPTYGMNWYYDNANLAAIPNGSQTILATDTLGPDGRGSAEADEFSNSPGQLAIGRHGGRANYLFMDGHVEWLIFSTTQSPDNMWGVDDNNHNQPVP